ncbi:E3 ubiquitin-protein ligase MARCH1-like protein, partial [Dinothrombium tinctorium]
AMDSNANIERSNICRICLSNDIEDGPLIEPCNCVGESAFVHAKCISKWVEISRAEICEFCKFKFIIVRKQKNFFDWIQEQNEDAAEFGIICVLFFLAFYLLCLGMIILSNSQTIPTLLSLAFKIYTALGFMVLAFATMVFIRHIYITYKSWSVTHFRVKVLSNHAKIRNLNESNTVLKSPKASPADDRFSLNAETTLNNNRIRTVISNEVEKKHN